MRIKRSTLAILIKRLTVIGVSVLVFAILYVVFITHLFTITAIELVGVKDEYKAEILSDLNEETTHKILGILPSNRIFSYRSLKFKKIITKTLPNVNDIHIGVRGLHTLRIVVTYYEPILRFEDAKAVTKDGILYNEIQDITALPLLTLATTTSFSNEELDGVMVTRITFLSNEKLESILSLVSKINSTIITVRRIDIDTYGDISLYDERGVSKVVFTKDQDVKKVWSNLVSAIDTDPLKTKLRDNKDNLEYLDVRFGNKVFYKFTNDTKTAIIQSHGTTTSATTTVSH